MKTSFASRVLPTRFVLSRKSGNNTLDIPLSDYSEKPKLNIASPASTPSGRAEAQDRRDQIISAKLARFAQVPASAIFELEPNWSYGGLSEEAASAALAKHGPNISMAERRLAAFTMWWMAVMNPFNILLTTLACVSIATKDGATFGVMMAMVVASTGLRYWQELKSMTQAIKLIKTVTTRVRIIRSRSLSSEEVEIDQKQVVPGDVLAVASGDVFPGDCVLISSEALTVTQASLTGELIPIEKTVRLVAAPQQEVFNLLDNENVCLAGTSVSTGNGRAIVVSTGSETYMASIAKELSKRRPQNAMQIGIKKVSYVLLGFLAVMAPIVFIIQGAVSHHWKGAIMFSIAVAVGLTPEMLPMIVVCLHPIICLVFQD
jgi:Mg2+-importing ATPase